MEWKASGKCPRGPSAGLKNDMRCMYIYTYMHVYVRTSGYCTNSVQMCTKIRMYDVGNYYNMYMQYHSHNPHFSRVDL